MLRLIKVPKFELRPVGCGRFRRDAIYRVVPRPGARFLWGVEIRHNVAFCTLLHLIPLHHYHHCDASSNIRGG